MKSEIDKSVLLNILKSANINLNLNQIDYIMINLIQNSSKYKEIPTKFLKELLEKLLEETIIEGKTDEKTKKNGNEIKENLLFYEDLEKTNFIQDVKIKNEKNGKLFLNENNEEKNHKEFINNNNNNTTIKTSKLPPIENKSITQSPKDIKNSQVDKSKKIMNIYGKFEIIEEEKIGESMESYNDYLIKIKPKNEESFSIVTFKL